MTRAERIRRFLEKKTGRRTWGNDIRPLEFDLRDWMFRHARCSSPHCSEKPSHEATVCYLRGNRQVTLHRRLCATHARQFADRWDLIFRTKPEAAQQELFKREEKHECQKPLT